jgi:membrane protein required for colicin V production
VTTIDVVLLVVVGAFVVRGLWRGFILEALGLAALVLGGLVATLYATEGAEILVAREVADSGIAPAVAGGGLFLGTYAAVTVVGVVLDKLARALFLGPVLRAAGVVFAALKAVLLLGLALVAGQRLVPGLVTPELVASSRLAGPMMDLATRALDFGGEWLGEAEHATAGAES